MTEPTNKDRFPVWVAWIAAVCGIVGSGFAIEIGATHWLPMVMAFFAGGNFVIALRSTLTGDKV